MQTFIASTAIVRVTRDPEVREFGTTKFAKFGAVANNRKKGQDGNYIDAPVFIDIKAFNQSADFVSQYVKKGDAVAVVGRVEMETWQKKDGSGKGIAFVIIADKVIALSGKDEQPQRPAAQPQRQRPVETKGQQPERDDEVRGEDIPF